MALDLTFTVDERNDNLVITMTDTTGTYDDPDNLTGWGLPNADLTAIDGATSTLELSLTVTISDGTETVYDDLDLYTEFGGGGFTDVNDLVFALTPDMFLNNGTALGAATDQFPDGIYVFNYIFDQGLGTEISTVSSVLIEGQVRNAVYELLRGIPKTYECKDCTSKQVLDAIFDRSYLDAIHSSAYVSKTEELYNQLYVLERLVTDGSTYTWR